MTTVLIVVYIILGLGIVLVSKVSIEEIKMQLRNKSHREKSAHPHEMHSAGTAKRES